MVQGGGVVLVWVSYMSESGQIPVSDTRPVSQNVHGGPENTVFTVHNPARRAWAPTKQPFITLHRDQKTGTRTGNQDQEPGPGTWEQGQEPGTRDRDQGPGNRARNQESGTGTRNRAKK